MAIAEPKPVAPSDGVLDAIREIVGPKGWVDNPAELEPYLVEERGLFQGAWAAVVRPATAVEVGGVVRLWAGAGVAIGPPGG
jgi:FAD/FMN-containing dehydrogenase